MSAFTAYLLPPAKEMMAELVPQAPAPAPATAIKVSWTVDPDQFPKRLAGLRHEIWISADPANPLGTRVKEVPYEQGLSTEIGVPPPGTKTIAVVLADRYGNQSPAAVASLPSQPPLAATEFITEFPFDLALVKSAMTDALARLGYSWREGDPNTESPYGGLLVCGTEGEGAASIVGCVYINAIGAGPQLELGEKAQTLKLTLVAIGSGDYLQALIDSEPPDEATLAEILRTQSTYRGVGIWRSSQDQPPTAEGWGAKGSVLTYVQRVMVKIETGAGCVGRTPLDPWHLEAPRKSAPCPPPSPAPDPMPILDALLDAAQNRHLFPPGTLK